LQDADGVAVLDYGQAQKAARDWWRAEMRRDEGFDIRHGPFTVGDAVADYLKAYERRGGRAVYGDIERIKRGRYCLPGASEDVSENMHKMRKKERSGPKPLKEQLDNGQSNDLTHLTQVSNGEKSASAEIANTDYLGPPGDNPADFLGDIPDFLDRRKQQARN
jgi:hypothetical protein